MAEPRLLVEADHDRIIQFLEPRYPYRVWVEDPSLLQQCVCLSVNDRGLIGLLWGHFVRDGVMTGHACLERPVDWRWLMPKLVDFASIMGADILEVSTTQAPRSKALGRLLTSFDFTRTHPDYYRRVIHGNAIPETTEDSGAPEAGDRHQGDGRR